MADDTRPLAPLIRSHREEAIEALTAHFANERIDTREFEERLDRVYAAKTLEEIAATHADLPTLPRAAGAAVGTLPAGAPVRTFQPVIAIFGGTERKGSWTPARQVGALALMGGVALDLREAILAPGVTELNVIAIMGGVEIIVPPGLRVECDGIGLLGGFENLDQAGTPGLADQPVLRIRGVAIMGGVEVTQRLPGESAGDRKRRLREERGRIGRGRRG